MYIIHNTKIFYFIVNRIPRCVRKIKSIIILFLLFFTISTEMHTNYKYYFCCCLSLYFLFFSLSIIPYRFTFLHNSCQRWYVYKIKWNENYSFDVRIILIIRVVLQKKIDLLFLILRFLLYHVLRWNQANWRYLTIVDIHHSKQKTQNICSVILSFEEEYRPVSVLH